MPENTKPAATNSGFPKITVVKVRVCESGCLQAIDSRVVAGPEATHGAQR
jgi:hypothetical protein